MATSLACLFLRPNRRNSFRVLHTAYNVIASYCGYTNALRSSRNLSCAEQNNLVRMFATVTHVTPNQCTKIIILGFTHGFFQGNLGCQGIWGWWSLGGNKGHTLLNLPMAFHWSYQLERIKRRTDDWRWVLSFLRYTCLTFSCLQKTGDYACNGYVGRNASKTFSNTHTNALSQLSVLLSFHHLKC